MTQPNPFPPMPPPSLSRDEVFGVLLDIQKNGWDVRTVDDYFVVRDTDEAGTEVKDINGGRCRVAPWSTTSVRPLLGNWATNLTQLRRALQQYLEGAPPERTRLVKGEPATNIARLAALIGVLKVVAVYDPYLDDAALDNLRAIAHLKPSCLDTAVRMLTAKRPPRISKAFAKAFCDEFGCNLANFQLLPPEEHRRFMLLSEDKVLIAGPSLNKLDWNEAANTELNTYDKPFFERMWATSSPMPW
jgi:hypothetical protein